MFGSRPILWEPLPYSNSAPGELFSPCPLSLLPRIQQNNAADNKSIENAVAGVGKLNIPLTNKSVTVKVKNVDMQPAASL